MTKTVSTTSTPAPERSKKEKQLIMARIVLLSFVLFFNSASATYLYSFLPQMMVSFGLAESTTDSGYYGAWMASGFFAGRFISASFWGAFIDKHGRKTGVIAALASISFCTFLFGFSNSYVVAFALRIITGLVNGLSIIGKTISTEICPDDFKAWSISVTNTIWALGMTCGPFIGSTFYGAIEGYPYLASSAVISLIGFLLTALAWYLFEETLPSKTGKTTAPSSSGSNSAPGRGFQRLDESGTEDDSTIEITQRIKTFGEMNKAEQLKYILNVPNVSKLIFIFGINTFYAAVIGELVPFWVAAQYKDGGLNFAYKQISAIYLYLTAPQLILQIFLYPTIQKKLGDFWLLSMGHLIHIPMFFMLPYAHLFAEGSGFQQTAWIVFWMFVRNMSSFMNFSALQRFTNDVISGDKRGRLNGFQVTFSSLLQISGPALGGALLSWSMGNGLPYPFNYHLVFLLMCVITVGVLAVIYRLVFVDDKRLKLKGEESRGL